MRDGFDIRAESVSAHDQKQRRSRQDGFADKRSDKTIEQNCIRGDDGSAGSQYYPSDARFGLHHPPTYYCGQEPVQAGEQPQRSERGVKESR